jgi:prefoldin beta subunit
MEDGDKVFKLIGPALVPQDKEEAVANVKTRLEFITAELTRHTRMAGEVGTKKQGIVAKCQELQAKMQKAQAALQKAQMEATKAMAAGAEE